MTEKNEVITISEPVHEVAVEDQRGNDRVTLENIGVIMEFCDKLAGDRPWFMCDLDGEKCVFFVSWMEREEKRSNATGWLLRGEDPLPSMNGKDFKMNGKWFFLEELYSLLKASEGGE